MSNETADKQSDSVWSKRIATLVVDALWVAKIVPDAQFDWAKEIAAEEIIVRLVAGDRPSG
jgi:hypothetical protein